jgi:hypothetical protein
MKEDKRENLKSYRLDNKALWIIQKTQSDIGLRRCVTETDALHYIVKSWYETKRKEYDTPTSYPIRKYGVNYLDTVIKAHRHCKRDINPEEDFEVVIYYDDILMEFGYSMGGVNQVEDFIPDNALAALWIWRLNPETKAPEFICSERYSDDIPDLDNTYY